MTSCAFLAVYTGLPAARVDRIVALGSKICAVALGRGTDLGCFRVPENVALYGLECSGLCNSQRTEFQS
jgi:hypothetical protein